MKKHEWDYRNGHTGEVMQYICKCIHCEVRRFDPLWGRPARYESNGEATTIEPECIERPDQEAGKNEDND
jgi:hypothetical protein